MLFLIALFLAIFVLPSPWGILALVVAAAIDITEICVGLWYSKRRRAAVGVESLVGRTGVAVGELGPEGQVKVDGEIWNAQSSRICASGSGVVVTAVDGLTLEVEPI